MKKTNQEREASHPLPPLAMTSLAQRKAELRAHRVQRLKRQLEEGSYEINTAEVARSIARNGLL